MRKAHSKKQQAVGFGGHLQLGLSHESLMKTNLSITLQIPVCSFPVSCFAGQQSQVSHESSHENHFFTNSSPNSHTQPLHYISQKYREMIEKKNTIKFDTELKPTK